MVLVALMDCTRSSQEGALCGAAAQSTDHAWPLRLTVFVLFARKWLLGIVSGEWLLSHWLLEVQVARMYQWDYKENIYVLKPVFLVFSFCFDSLF